MFGFVNLFNSAKRSRAHLKIYEIVRWKRTPKKPFWLGIAKTKMFKIPVRKVLPPDQQAEFSRLTDLYDKQVAALTHFKANDEVFRDLVRRSESNYSPVTPDIIEQSLLINQEWNAQCAAMREEREKIKSEEMSQLISMEIERKEEKARILKMKAEELIKSEIEKSSTFITRDNLNEAIDKCLASVQDYNFAVDKSGNIYEGDQKKPTGKLSKHKDAMKDNSSDDSKDNT